MGRLANALQHRKGWDIDLVCNVMDDIVRRATTRVDTECEVAWLAYEEGLLDVVTGPVIVDVPLAAGVVPNAAS
jgi:hypothetical protein